LEDAKQLEFVVDISLFLLQVNRTWILVSWASVDRRNGHTVDSFGARHDVGLRRVQLLGIKRGIK
jgi:hypothetical protein